MDLFSKQTWWTGGQYSLWRVALGLYLLSVLAARLPDATAGLGALLALLVAIGWRDRLAAVALGLLLAWMPGAPLAGWLLILHAFVPPAPYGSLAAGGRVDPRGDWHLPAPLCWACWLALAGIYAYSAYCKMLLFVPELVLLHLLTVNPRWLRSSQTEPSLVFYDGECGLCQRAVRFVLSEDVGEAWRLSPLQGETFTALGIAESAIPDSMGVKVGDRLLWHSSAVVLLLWRIGGYWRVAGALLWCVPKPLRDLGYVCVARVRRSLFAKPSGLCPLMPPDLAARFQA
jgi:predicted DCC family thiol-disulfide oxidoreductase YuxK